MASPFWRSADADDDDNDVDNNDDDATDTTATVAVLPLRWPMPREMLMPPTRFCATVERSGSSGATSLLLLLLLQLVLDAAALLPTFLVAFNMFLMAAAALTGDC